MTDQAIAVPAASPLEKLRPVATEQLQKAIDRAKSEADSMVIDSDEKAIYAFELRKSLKSHKVTWEAGANLSVNSLHQAHKDAVKARDEVSNQIDAIDATLERKRIAFKDEQEKKRQAEADRQRLAAKAEQDAAAVEHAQALQDSGEPEAAQAVIEHAASAPAPAVYVASTVTRSKGEINKTKYTYTVKNEDLVPKMFKMEVLNHKTIKAQVDSLGLKANIPGVEVTEVKREGVRLA